ncbi:tetratricopeptide repeat protein [Novosphingobium sp. KCTC 2891]|uniref:tetratricopeptide repeat protein n=1 Tax=Novosphingobium sp. KCTC 2891 TaxID=2989730 RepID=UPI002223D89D|nr:tetratricopeptide repeat protein [Novosphingobium sp. KCTC 2891]
MLLFPPPVFPADLAEAPAALMQVGPNPSQRQSSPLPIPRRRTVIEAAPGAEQDAQQMPGTTRPAADKPLPDRLTACLATGRQDLTAGLASARMWRDEGKTAFEKVRANQCLGLLLNQQGDYAGAETAFADAIAGIPPEQAVGSVQLLAMAGNAALAAGKADRAADWFDKALAVKDYKDNAALGAIQTDRARALVAAGRMAEAGGALDEAHRLAPDDPDGWLLSATLARRSGDLARAQRDIEIAANLDPRDPAIGLEAGVIAVLDGRDAAAMKSWDSVIKAAPNSAEAKTAAGYLEQLGPAPTSAPVPQEKKPS